MYRKNEKLSIKLLGFVLDLSILERIMMLSKTCNAQALTSQMLSDDNDLSDEQALLTQQHLDFALAEIFQHQDPRQESFDAIRNRINEIFFDRWGPDFSAREAILDNEFIPLKLKLASSPDYLDGNIMYYGRFGGKNDPSCIQMAIEAKNGPMVKLLFDAGAGQKTIYELEADKSIYAIAAKLGVIEPFEWLVQEGYSAIKLFHMNVNTLMIAAEYGHLDLVEFMLEHNKPKPKISVDQSQNHVLNDFSKNPTDIDMQDRRTGYSALLHACHNGHASVVERLLAAKADPTLCSKLGSGVLFTKALQQHPKVIAQLIAQGAKVEDWILESIDCLSERAILSSIVKAQLCGANAQFCQEVAYKLLDFSVAISVDGEKSDQNQLVIKRLRVFAYTLLLLPEEVSEEVQLSYRSLANDIFGISMTLSDDFSTSQKLTILSYLSGFCEVAGLTEILAMRLGITLSELPGISETSTVRLFSANNSNNDNPAQELPDLTQSKNLDL